MSATTAISSVIMHSDPLLSPESAAEYIGVQPSTMAIWRSTGRYAIQYIKTGRLVKYRKSALDAFLERRTQGGGAA